MRKFTELLTPFRSGMLLGVSLTSFVLSVAFWGQADQKSSHRPADKGGNAHPEQKSEDPIAGWWRWTLSGDSSGFYTFGLIAVGTFQVWLFYWQLGLIRDSLADTKKAAKAAKRQARLARDSLIASNRPWLKVEINCANGIFASDDTAGSTVSVIVENIGNIVAFDIAVEVWCLGWNLRQPPLDNPMLIEHRRRVSAPRGAERVGDFTLFPGEKYPGSNVSAHYINCLMDKEDIDHSSFPTNDGKRRIVMHFGGRVTYTFATTNRHHTTSVLYEVIYNRNKGFITTDLGAIGPEDIEIERSNVRDGCWAD